MNLKGLNPGIAIVTLLFFLLIPVSGHGAKIVTDPAPPGLTTSPDFTLTGNGKTIWVERIYNDPDNIDYMIYGGKEMEDMN
ncbi:MAG: hypothetical protein PF495_06020, partial [Spirochaetales bacterium]|nr:hypothetical protein [Spirochaetales bacterium]